MSQRPASDIETKSESRSNLRFGYTEVAMKSCDVSIIQV